MATLSGILFDFKEYPKFVMDEIPKMKQSKHEYSSSLLYIEFATKMVKIKGMNTNQSATAIQDDVKRNLLGSSYTTLQ